MPRSVARLTAGLFFLGYSLALSAQTTSEGVGLTGASSLHSQAFKGQGVSVAIIDSGFDDASVDRELGDNITRVTCFPACQEVDAFTPDNIHGSAAAEIVHEMAPDSHLYLIASDDRTGFRNAVQYCIDHQIRIISHSRVAAEWQNFLDGMCHYAYGDPGNDSFGCVVRNAVNHGILFVNGMANDAQHFFEGTFTDVNPQDGYHDTDIALIILNNSVEASLTWDGWPVSSDFNLVLFGPNGQEITSGRPSALLPLAPVRSLTRAAQPGSYLRVKRVSGSGNPRFKIRFQFPGSRPASPTPYGSLATPADIPGVISVGAIDHSRYTTASAPDSYSSRGPTSDGRLAPLLTAPTNVQSDSMGELGGRFEHTSAATPHVAGAAALLLSQNPTWSYNQLYNALLARTVDMGVPGPDNDFGFGRLDLTKCNVPAPVLSAPSKVSSGTTYTVSWTASADGWYELQESASSAFTSPTIYGVNGLSRAVAYTTASPLTYHYRVRGFCSNTPSPWSAVKTVSICNGPTATTIQSTQSVSANSTNNRALTGDDPSLPRTWTIANGTITAQDAYGIYFTAGPSGSVTLGVTVGSGVCARSATKTLPICTTTVAPTSLTVPAAGGWRWLTLMSGCVWTVRSNAPWLTVATPSSGNGNASTAIIVAPNTASAPRTGTVEIGGVTITFTQLGTVSLRSDVDGDGRDDHIAFHRSTGQTTVRLMDGATVVTEGIAATAMPTWRAVEVPGADGDGRADLIWRDPSAAGILVWLLAGTMATEGARIVPDPDPSWIALAVADFDGDGKADVLWRHATTHAVDVTLMDRFTVRSRGRIGVTNAEWVVADVGDVNGDGRFDVIWRNTSTGGMYIHLLNGASVLAAQGYAGMPMSWTLAAVADIDGDAKADILWRNGTGQVKVQRMNGLTMIEEGIAFTDTDTTWPVLGTGDFNGDGVHDIFWWKSSGELRILQMNGFSGATPLAVAGSYPVGQWAIIAPVTPQTAHRQVGAGGSP
jgi:hypothetical protein